MPQIGQSSLVFTTNDLSGTIAGWSAGGWISGTAMTRTINTDTDQFLSIYIGASGAGGAPTDVKVVDGIGGVTLASLVRPATNGTSLNMVGPMSGANVANALGYINVVVPPKTTLMVQHSASQTAFYRVEVYGK